MARVLAQHVALIKQQTGKAPARPPIPLRTADTTKYSLGKEHPWVFTRAGLIDPIRNAAIGSFEAPSTKTLLIVAGVGLAAWMFLKKK